MAKAKAKQFTFFWLDGSRNVLEGVDAIHALRTAGIGGTSLRALDFWSAGDDKGWQWQDSRWQQIPA